ncbi:hypothetical protein CEXT_267841 [Caerostris extrusa]|uniref:C2H2-type domain-containing protein n=1 Tax=Caerostris extrusa TaxID=172846 RepID=A0AAV4V321_CAEEX|nr:hypothetical protein CEXT_267841 [Caerostris extrusa]
MSAKWNFRSCLASLVTSLFTLLRGRTCATHAQKLLPSGLSKTTHACSQWWKPYTCDICQKSFPQLSGLLHHAGVHSTEKPHRCDYCDFKTAHKSSLKDHLRRYHSEHKEECPLCCSDFYSKDSLRFHKCKRKMSEDEKTSGSFRDSLEDEKKRTRHFLKRTKSTSSASHAESLRWRKCWRWAN